jgi:DNA repair protein RecO (recombination protein O)
MSKTYKATGINLKVQAFGESDRIITVLTREFGIIKAIAPGARKHHSSLGGRSGMFVVNELLVAKGRSLDKITQAQTVKSYPGLAKDLGKLAASQYLAELVLCQALSEHPQEELYELLNEHLSRIEAVPSNKNKTVLAYLAHAVFQFLAIAGLTPQVYICCLSQCPLKPDFTDSKTQVGFSITSGGVVSLSEWKRIKNKLTKEEKEEKQTKEGERDYQTVIHQEEIPTIFCRLNAKELNLLQRLPEREIMPEDSAKDSSWLLIEQILRNYAQYHFGQIIRSAALIDSYFAANL